MGISIVKFQRLNSEPQWGVASGQTISPIIQSFASHRDVMARYFAHPEPLKTDSAMLQMKDVALLSPVSNDVQIFCQGLNYASHKEEGGLTGEKGQNLIFTKPPSTICGPNDDIVRPGGCELLDYEVELALILKQDLPANTSVDKTNLLDYVGGLTLANDVSARDFMFGAPMMQWFKGKGQRTFCPTGPILYLLDDSDQVLLSNLQLTLSVNGEIRQDATTDQMIFKPEETLTELASFADIKTGDMLLTGTPGGVTLNASFKVGLAILLNFTNDDKRRQKLVKTQDSVRYLEPGDQLTLSLKSRDGTLDLGTQNNGVRDAA